MPALNPPMPGDLLPSQVKTLPGFYNFVNPQGEVFPAILGVFRASLGRDLMIHEITERGLWLSRMNQSETGFGPYVDGRWWFRPLPAGTNVQLFPPAPATPEPPDVHDS